MKKWEFFKQLTRIFSITVMIVPVILGTVAAYAVTKEFHWFLFLVTLVGAVSAHIFSNLINDLWDYRNGADTKAVELEGDIATHSAILTSGKISEKRLASITWGFLLLAAVCGLVLTMICGWPILVLAVVGALLAYFYVAPPLKLGYRGKGYGEMAIFISFGVLPVLGAYYVQTGEFHLTPLLLSFPIGMLTTMLLYNHHFLHRHADAAAGKNTLVVVWGEEKGLRASKIMTALAYVFVIIAVAFGALPVYGLIAIISIIPLYKVYKTLSNKENPTEAYLPLFGASQQSSVLCGLMMVIAIFIQIWTT